jgi:L-iditol 2-dehydrogenase
MRALLLSEYNHLGVTDVPTPAPAADEILIQVSACGICGSDVHGYDGSTGRRIPPIVMGHEAAGVVVDVGSATSRFQIGDRVTFDSTVFCGQCAYCLRGEVNLCNQRQVIGVSCGEYRRAGAFAEFLAVPERIACRLPDSFSFAQAAMLEAVSVALHGVAVADIAGGESVLVIGAGMIGLLLLQAARAAGAARVFVSDVDPSRLELAANLGADFTFLATGAPLLEQILAHTGGNGVDVVLEAVGLEQSITSAIDCTRKGGTVALIGNISPQISLPLQKVVSRQIRLQGSCASAGEYPQAIELIANGKIKVDSLITAIAPLSEGPSWFERLHAHEPNLMKIVLDPRLDSQPAEGVSQP